MRRFLLAGLSLTFAALAAFSVQAQEAPKREPVRIAFVGDSMADGLWQGVTRVIARNACLKSFIETERFGRNGTGLTRLDRFNWPRELRAIGTRFNPHLVVVSVGLNDRNPIYDPDGRNAQIYSKEWPEVYREKVAKMLQSATAMKANVLWIGIPALRETAPDKEAREKNTLYAAEIAALNDPSVRYVEPWRLKVESEDVFSTYGPDEKGALIALRTSDGVHFTPAGYDRVGSYLYPRIVESLRQRGIDLEKACPEKAGAEPDQHSGVKTN